MLEYPFGSAWRADHNVGCRAGKAAGSRGTLLVERSHARREQNHGVSLHAFIQAGQICACTGPGHCEAGKDALTMQLPLTILPESRWAGGSADKFTAKNVQTARVAPGWAAHGKKIAVNGGHWGAQFFWKGIYLGK